MCFVKRALIVVVIVILLVIGVMSGIKKEDNKEQNNYRKIYIAKNLNIINSEKTIQNEINKVRDTIIEKETRFERLSQEFLITAYDLSVTSCGKSITNRGYGLTRTEFSLRGLNWQTARVISVDPTVIPLNSKVEIRFNDSNYMRFNGIYSAQDTGGAIKGNHIDLFYEDCGSLISRGAMDFGKTYAKVMVIK